MRHGSFIQIVAWCLIPALLFSSTGCYYFRQIPLTTIPGEETHETIDDLLPRQVADKARVKVVLHDKQIIEGRVVDYSDPILQIRKGKQVLDIDKREIAEVHRQKLDIVETVQWSLGVIGVFALIYGISKIGDIKIKELNSVFPD